MTHSDSAEAIRRLQEAWSRLPSARKLRVPKRPRKLTVREELQVWRLLETGRHA